VIKSSEIAIIEAKEVGDGTTAYSTGNLYIPVQPFYSEVVKKYDEETVKKIANARKSMIDFIENNVREKNIDCNFMRRPWYCYATEDDKVALLEEEVNLLKKFGFDIDYTQELPYPFKFKKAAVMHNQGRFNPFKYITAMAQEL